MTMRGRINKHKSKDKFATWKKGVLKSEAA